jgi:hypothetical protein
LVDSSRYRQRADGSYRIADTAESGAGVYRVRIGPHVFTCLRVIDLDHPVADESTELNVAFVEPGGRTILYRQYRGRAMNDDWQAWRAAHPGREVVINDNLFLQRDCTGRAHDVLTTTSMDTSRAHALDERSVINSRRRQEKAGRKRRSSIPRPGAVKIRYPGVAGGGGSGYWSTA